MTRKRTKPRTLVRIDKPTEVVVRRLARALAWRQLDEDERRTFMLDARDVLEGLARLQR